MRRTRGSCLGCRNRRPSERGGLTEDWTKRRNVLRQKVRLQPKRLSGGEACCLEATMEASGIRPPKGIDREQVKRLAMCRCHERRCGENEKKCPTTVRGAHKPPSCERKRIPKHDSSRHLFLPPRTVLHGHTALSPVRGTPRRSRLDLSTEESRVPTVKHPPA